MTQDFIPYEQALELKELGFDEPCLATYNGETLDLQLQIPSDDYFTAAPLYQQAFRWFREKYGLHLSINVKDNIWYFERFSIKGFKTYEEAELVCLKKLIEIVKQK